MELLFLLIFLFGLCLGSFLNVLADRLPNDESPLKGRSYCDHCKRTLLWFELLPLLSFMLQKGKCRSCHKQLSWQYPISEILTGVLFVYAWYVFLPTVYPSMFIDAFGLLYILFILSCLIVILFADVRFGIIPDTVIFPAIVISLFYRILTSPDSLWMYLIAGICAFLFFLALFLITKGKGMGFGDVKLVFLLGLFLGIQKTLIALYIGFLTGAFVACILVVWRKKRFFGETIPFGPFLVLGTFVSYFFIDHIGFFIPRVSHLLSLLPQ